MELPKPSSPRSLTTSSTSTPTNTLVWQTRRLLQSNQVRKDQRVLVATTKTKKQNKPASSLNMSVLKKDLSQMEKAVTNQVADNYYRRDLKKAALARLSAVSLRVSKSGIKKRNRQA